MSDNSRVRVSIVGVVIVALFASLFARLWFLQMGPEQKLGQPVSSLGTRVIQTESPRGEILDRNGKVLAQDVAAWAVTVDRNLSKTARDRVLGQLSEVLGIKEPTLLANYVSPRQSPLMPAVVALRVPLAQQLAIREHRESYPGVNVTELTIRAYPYDGLASQLLGYVGGVDAVDPKLFKQLRAKGYQTGDLIGRSGVEAAYESQLRGRPRKVTVQVDPTGRQVGAPINVDPGTVGNNVRLTIDIKVQRAAERALAEGILAARNEQDITTAKTGYTKLKATGGSVVVLDVHNGSVVAMANYPTYPLSWWVGGISADHYTQLSNADAQNPLLNRATEGQYAPGSTFKLVPAIALNQYNVLGASNYVDDKGFVRINGSTFNNDNNTVNGPVNLQKALTLSSDVYFYNAGFDFWNIWNVDPNRGLGIQHVASDLGFGKSSGIEVGDAVGRIPDPTWRAAFAKANYKTAEEVRQNSIWYPKDNIFTAVGQGDDFVTPLQLVNAYACFANATANGGKGTLWTPHVGQSVSNPVTRKAVESYTPKAIGNVTIDPYVLSQISAGFNGVISDPKGTAYEAFKGLPVAVAGKTGTAQIPGKGPTSLFASYFPVDNPRYAVVAVVEQAGHGAQIAAPVVRQVIESMRNLPSTPIPTVVPGAKD
ncbi:MAG: penicillin-binding protein 2 [Actinomycetota bacterium]|nr:penicillin-binding protein 2 [Actinomycetota bacterium]